MNKPNTKYVLVRTPRINNQPVHVKMLHNFGEGFDFTDYSYLRSSDRTGTFIEEWVPTAELELYKRVMKL